MLKKQRVVGICFVQSQPGGCLKTHWRLLRRRGCRWTKNRKLGIHQWFASMESGMLVVLWDMFGNNVGKTNVINHPPVITMFKTIPGHGRLMTLFYPHDFYWETWIWFKDPRHDTGVAPPALQSQLVQPPDDHSCQEFLDGYPFNLY